MTIQVTITAIVDAGQVREWGVAGTQEVAKVNESGTLEPYVQPIGADQCVAVAADFVKAVATQKAREAHQPAPSGILIAR